MKRSEEIKSIIRLKEQERRFFQHEVNEREKSIYRTIKELQQELSLIQSGKKLDEDITL